MNTEIICPDCGKVIAPPDAGVDATARCRCGESANDSRVWEHAKKCFVCGKDLDGRKRLKDRLGRYWCSECARADRRARRRAKGLQCADCYRMFPAHKLVMYEGVKLCRACERGRQKTAEDRLKALGIDDARQRNELRLVTWMALALLGLAILATVQWLF